MIAIITSALPLLLKFIGWLLNRAEVKEQTKREWLKFMEIVELDLKGSVELNNSDAKQKNDLDKKWEDKWGNKS